nr:MAG TPA: hypothetical protein [Caudoviricetes sp.]
MSLQVAFLLRLYFVFSDDLCGIVFILGFRFDQLCDSFQILV